MWPHIHINEVLWQNLPLSSNKTQNPNSYLSVFKNWKYPARSNARLDNWDDDVASYDVSASQAKQSTHHTDMVAKPLAVSIPWTCSYSRELEPPPEFSSSELDELLIHRPSSKGTKLLLQVIKAIINQSRPASCWQRPSAPGPILTSSLSSWHWTRFSQCSIWQIEKCSKKMYNYVKGSLLQW